VIQAFSGTARAFRFVVGIGLACLTLVACSREVDHRPLSLPAYQQTSLQEVFDARFWGDDVPPNLEERVRESIPILRERFPDAIDASPETAPFQRALAISGGGANGAFGAGVLAGWTESGMRFEFDTVTGVSTGAIIAPFAFLGPNYDDTVVDIYASGTREKVFNLALFSGFLFGSAVADTTPLKQQIEKYFTLDVIEAIAQEHEKGRNLFIITTHFDARRPVVWNVGEIAAHRDQGAVSLIQQIVLASAAIPAFFPPVPIEFELNGQAFTELHVDGGLSHSAFAYPAQIPVAELNEILGLTFRREVYVIVNSNEQFGYEPAPTGVVSIAGRAVQTLLRNQMRDDVERIYRLSRRDGLTFNMIVIPESFEASGATDFDPDYMRTLLELGREIGRTGTFWRDRPLSVGPEE
jgi:predicted patatin/cPLA2 family phospholipase